MIMAIFEVLGGHKLAIHPSNVAVVVRHDKSDEVFVNGYRINHTFEEAVEILNTAMRPMLKYDGDTKQITSLEE